VAVAVGQDKTGLMLLLELAAEVVEMVLHLLYLVHRQLMQAVVAQVLVLHIQQVLVVLAAAALVLEVMPLQDQMELLTLAVGVVELVLKVLVRSKAVLQVPAAQVSSSSE
jgi:hypothetical protein